MAVNHESQPSQERKSRFLRVWKTFNKVSAAVLATAGIIFEQPVLLGLAAIDVIQNILINKYEKWRAKRQASKKIGGAALQTA